MTVEEMVAKLMSIEVQQRDGLVLLSFSLSFSFNPPFSCFSLFLILLVGVVVLCGSAVVPHHEKKRNQGKRKKRRTEED